MCSLAAGISRACAKAGLGWRRCSGLAQRGRAGQGSADTLPYIQGGRACGQVQQAEVGVHNGLLPHRQQRHLGHCRLRAGRLHLADQEHHLRARARALSNLR